MSNKFPGQLDKVLEWVKDERHHQIFKFDYSVDDIKHIREGAGENSWLWQQILNYVGRIRLFSLETPQGRQAYMKLIAALVGLGEAMINVYGLPPAPGVPSGEINEWDRSKRIYVSGPMTGILDKNFSAFKTAEEKLKSLGYIPVNPAYNESLEAPEGWNDFMRHDLPDMLSCRAMILLEGWEDSKGCLVELELAESINIPVFTSIEDLVKSHY